MIESSSLDREFYNWLAKLHGHRCPMSILGARMAAAALEALRPRIDENSYLSAKYFHQTCAIDGIQLVTGCTLGNNNIQIESKKGEHRMVLWIQKTRDSVSANLTPYALTEGRSYGSIKKAGNEHPEGSPERAEKTKEMEELLLRLESAPDDELVEVVRQGF